MDEVRQTLKHDKNMFDEKLHKVKIVIYFKD